LLAVPKKQPSGKAIETQPAPARKRPGPKPFVPMTADRELVTLAVAIGMTIAEISDAVEVPKRTLCRAFVRELAVGRSKRVLANAARLDKAASEGNVAAMKALQIMMDRGGKLEMAAAVDDPWAAVAEQIKTDQANLARFQEFGKAN
jgi:hypothetical protein